MIEKVSPTTIEKKPKKNSLNEKNFSELKNFFHKLVKNFWEIRSEDKKFLEERNFSENFLIENFKIILNRRAEQWESWIIFLIEEIKNNKKIYEIFYEEIKFSEEIFKTKKKIFHTIWN